MRIVVIHGPQATGKTLHASRFAAHYGCTRTLDWTHTKQHEQPRDGDLLLTTEMPTKILRALPDAILVPVNDARRAVGLGAAPVGGFKAGDHLPATGTDFAVLGVKLPLTNAGDAELVDANDAVVVQIDPHGSLPDDLADRIANLIMRAVNMAEFAV